MKSKEWLDRQNRDFFVNKAKNIGYLSRSAFKILEIEKKFKLIINSKNILELGSAPGSWSQFIININSNVKIDAFDLLDMKFKHDNINFLKKDFLKFNFKSLHKKYDLILSDLSPNSIGHKGTDHLRIISLVNEIILVLDLIANKKSSFVFKIFKGIEEKDLILSLKMKYKKIDYFKPKSSRKDSSEIYIIARQFIY